MIRCLSLRAPVLLLSLIQVPGQWMCPGVSPQLRLRKQWLPEQPTELVQVQERVLELLLSRLELARWFEPMLALLL